MNVVTLPPGTGADFVAVSTDESDLTRVDSVAGIGDIEDNLSASRIEDFGENREGVTSRTQEIGRED